MSNNVVYSSFSVVEFFLVILRMFWLDRFKDMVCRS